MSTSTQPKRLQIEFTTATGLPATRKELRLLCEAMEDLVTRMIFKPFPSRRLEPGEVHPVWRRLLDEIGIELQPITDEDGVVGFAGLISDQKCESLHEAIAKSIERFAVTIEEVVVEGRDAISYAKLNKKFQGKIPTWINLVDQDQLHTPPESVAARRERTAIDKMTRIWRAAVAGGDSEAANDYWSTFGVSIRR
ncbi:hypothetical protein MAPG_04888 [Magnaporthiopsis poae ATCC 64411]|uniref:Uncharacterized protein n=1 Tax=Magnaporthiopsis poae (strain ATCC 64411 / 73-15) TaxID=644358 RepID=A0A0C4DXY1_MAGP6|nr:hypothetical protein MAPG_04888 [Magnaporthiopsis poae ATCC 64411]